MTDFVVSPGWQPGPDPATVIEPPAHFERQHQTQVATVASGKMEPGLCGLRTLGTTSLPVGMRLSVLGSPGRVPLQRRSGALLGAEHTAPKPPEKWPVSDALAQRSRFSANLHTLAGLPLKTLAELEVVNSGDGWAHARILAGEALVNARVYLIREDD